MSVLVNVVAGTGHGTQAREGGAREEFAGVLIGLAEAPMKRRDTQLTANPASNPNGDALNATEECGV